MIAADLTRNLNFVTLANYAPFIYVGTTKYRTLKTEWGDDLDDLFETGARVKVLQATRDYLNKYLVEDTYAEMEAQEGSIYIDTENQLVYIHVEHDYSPQTANVDYGYGFGVIDEKAGGTYIDDFYYEPVITDDVDISMTADTKGVSQPTGSSSSMTLNNTARYNELTKLPEGVLDFMLTENLYHNDMFVYNFDGGVLVPLASYYLEDFDPSETQMTLNLQDRRFT